jgi:hypothetical protein
MDKKIRNRILYVVVAGLWGIAIYRTFGTYLSGEQQKEMPEVFSLPPVSPALFNKDTFELLLPERDPFLGNSWTAVTKNEILSSSEKPKNEIKKEVPVRVEKNWPAVEYFGFVKNRNKNSTLSLVKIDGRLVQLSKGEEHDGIVVSNVYPDSILLVMEGDRKVFRK